MSLYIHHSRNRNARDITNRSIVTWISLIRLVGLPDLIPKWAQSSSLLPSGEFGLVGLLQETL